MERQKQRQRMTIAALDVPFLLLPFRPSSDPSAAKTFVRNYFFPPADRKKLTGPSLVKEVKMTEVMVSRQHFWVELLLTPTAGYRCCDEVVFGSTSWRSCDMGGIPGIQSW